MRRGYLNIEIYVHRRGAMAHKLLTWEHPIGLALSFRSGSARPVVNVI